MRVVLLHDDVGEQGTPDAADVFEQIKAVHAALVALGCETVTIPCTLDLAALKARLAIEKADLVFNLVESLAGQGQLIHLVPSLLDAMRIRYTGASASSIFWTTNKLLAKQTLRRAGLPTPDWGEFENARPPLTMSLSSSGSNAIRIDGGDEDALPVGHHGETRWIIKSIFEHASLGLDENSVVSTTSKMELESKVRARGALLQDALFAERFVEGREFNLSVFSDESGPNVLPVAEIRFENFADDQPKIVDYRAKWDESSLAWKNTPRSFDLLAEDAPLVKRLELLTRACWALFQLRGYARVDFRVDRDGSPWILEVNANPCLSPDAGFAAALARRGISFRTFVEHLLRNADPERSHR